MFGNGSDENENDKDERFLENGFGIKKLFGQVNKAKEEFLESL